MQPIRALSVNDKLFQLIFISFGLVCVRGFCQLPIAFKHSKLLSKNKQITLGDIPRDIGLLVEQTLDTAEDAFLHLRRSFQKPVEISGEITEYTNKKTKVVILGTGWSSHACAKILDTDLFDVTCVSPRPYFVFTPMLASTALGTIEPRSIVEPMRSSNPLVRYVQAEVIDILPQQKKLIIQSSLRETPPSFEMQYDHLVYAVGSQVADFGLTGVRKYCYFIKEVDDVRRLKSRILANFETALLPETTDEEISRLLTFVTVGAGPTGVEFVSELSDFIEEKVSKFYPKLEKKIKLIILDSGSSILSAFDAALRQQALDSIKARGIDVRLENRVIAIEDTTITYQGTTPQLSSNQNASNSTIIQPQTTTIGYGICVWAAGNSPRPLSSLLAKKLGAAEQPVFTRTGRLPVDPWLRLRGLDQSPGAGGTGDESAKKRLLGSIFAMGDCCVTNKSLPEGVKSGRTYLGEGPLPQTAQVAAQQGAFVAHILNRQYNTSTPVPTLGPDVVWANPIRWLKARGVVNASPFQFLNFGILTYIGGDEALAQVRLGDSKVFDSKGENAYLLWKSVYIVKQVSLRTRVLVLFDYFKAKVLGRDLTGV